MTISNLKRQTFKWQHACECTTQWKFWLRLWPGHSHSRSWGLTSHQTQYRSYRGRVLTGQMTQPTVSKHCPRQRRNESLRLCYTLSDDENNSSERNTVWKSGGMTEQSQRATSVSARSSWWVVGRPETSQTTVLYAQSDLAVRPCYVQYASFVCWLIIVNIVDRVLGG